MNATDSTAQAQRQNQALLIEKQHGKRSAMISFSHEGLGSDMAVAFEPTPGSWDALADGPCLDPRRLLARPWRGSGQDVMMPGSILIDAHGPNTSYDIDVCLLNCSLAARHITGLDSLTGPCAIDAGACWIIIPAPQSRDAWTFLRKDGVAKITHLDGANHYPQDQEAYWAPSELEQASLAVWKLCLATAKILSVDFEANHLMRQAHAEITAHAEHVALSHAVPHADEAFKARKQAL
jgi:hypothetical protein